MSARIFVLGLGLLWVAETFAARHLMQIEQVIGNVDGDTAAQAVQLRLRSNFQNRVANHVVVAFDAAGENPVVLINFPSDAASGSGGDRILVATSRFEDLSGLTADFQMDNPLPESYLDAGRVVFGNSTLSSIFWSLAWGGANYTGPTTGATTNDTDGDFGPPVDADLAKPIARSLLFTGAAGAVSTTNLADYITMKDPVFTNNAGDSALVLSEFIFIDGGFEGDDPG